MRHLVAVAALAAVVAAPVAASADTTVAVLDIEAMDAPAEAARLVTRALLAHFRASTGVRDLSGKRLAELKLVFGCLDEAPACMVQIARNVGGGQLLYGSMRQEGDRYPVTLKLLDVAGGRQVWERTFTLRRSEAHAAGVRVAVKGWLADVERPPRAGADGGGGTAAGDDDLAGGPGDVNLRRRGGGTLPRAYLGARVGAVVPFFRFSPGYEVGAEVQYRLPLAALGHRLRASLFFGVIQAASKESRLFPGRGLEPEYVENITSLPLEAMAHFEVWRHPRHALTVSAGYMAWFTTTEVVAFGATSHTGGVGHAVVGTVAYRLRLGPGEIAAVVRAGWGRGDFGGVDRAGQLGPTGKVGERDLSSVTFTLAYLHGFFAR